jgi:hypothetical protein
MLDSHYNFKIKNIICKILDTLAKQNIKNNSLVESLSYQILFSYHIHIEFNEI